MARLTRTQKYAELRDKIAQDREESLKTEGLSTYEDKLKKLESFFNNEPDNILEKKVEQAPVEAINLAKEEKPVADEIKLAQEESMKSLDEILTSMLNNYSNEPVVEEAKVEDTKPEVTEEDKEEILNNLSSKVDELAQIIEEKKETKNTVTIDSFVKPVETVEEEVIQEEVKPTENNETVETKPEDLMSTMEIVVSEVEDLSHIIDDEKVANEEVPQETTAEEVKPIEEEITREETKLEDLMSTMEIVASEVEDLSNIIDEGKPAEKEVEMQNVQPIEEVADLKDEQTIDNSFFNDTLKEVDDFNRNEGRTTLEELPNEIVDEVRHPQVPPIKEQEESLENDDFSNTVSLEIDKVLDEIRNQNNQLTVEVPTETVNNKEAEIEIERAFKTAEVKQETFEHPVLAKTMEEPVVEIKNISETFNNPVVDNNVLDDTIPFVVEKNEDEEDEDEYEDETPSKVLNVILGILIFVLVAVLGVIVYYILVARGIIG